MTKTKDVKIVDQAVRDKITGESDIKDLKRAQFVMAGAGAGKTHSINYRVLNLISKCGISPEKLVIITYTTKAANELITRIRQTLEENIALENAESALSKLDEAKISTFHSFCYDLLREYPIEFCIDPDANLLCENATDIMLENCFSAMQAECHNDQSNYRVKFKDEMKLFLELVAEVKEMDLKKSFLSLYQNRDLAPIDVDLSKLNDPEILIEDARAAASNYYNEAQEVISEIKPGKEVDKQYQHICEIFLPAIKKLSEAQFIESVINGDGLKLMAKGGAKTNYKNPTLLAQVKSYKKEVEQAVKYQENYGKVVNYNKILKVYRYFEEFVTEYKKLYGVIDFFDCLYVVKTKLSENEHLRKLIQNRFEAVIIDEFQDSDPMQADIAFYLAGENTDKLFFVGDPKQSIYGFARADISIYLEIMNKVKELENGQVLELSTNFRTSGGLLNFINANFSKILIQDENKKDISVNYTKMDEAQNKKDGPYAISQWHVTHQLTDEEKKPSAADQRSRESFMIAKRIKEMISSGQYHPGDFLVLFKTSTAMEVYEDALRALEVPVTNTKSKNFLKKSEVMEFLNLLSLCAFPQEAFYKEAIRQSEFIQIDEKELERYLEGESSFLDKFEELCRNSGFISLSLSASDDINIRFIQNLLSLAKVELEASRGDIKKALYNLKTKAESDSYFSDVKIEDETIYLQKMKSDTVRLMTIHASKGLESKVVILSAHTTSEFSDSKYVDRLNQKILPEVPLISKTIAQSLNCEELCQMYEQAALRREFENKRVLYVAITRAEEDLIIITKEPEDKNSNFLKILLDQGPVFKTKIELDINDCVDDYDSRVRYIALQSEEISSNYNADSFEKLCSTDGVSVSVTSLIENKELFRDIDGRKNGMEFGTFTHMVMEYLCSMIFESKALKVDSDALIDKLYKESLLKFEESYIKDLKGAVTKFLESDLAKSITGATSIQTEIPFVYSGGYHGIIDLLIEDKDGVMIVDFKSDLLNTKNDEIKKHYKKQITLYVDALKESLGKDIKGQCCYLFEKQCK